MKRYSAIEQMYEGERGLGDLIPLSEEYKKHFGRFLDCYEKFVPKIKYNEELSKLFEEIMNASDEAHCEGVFMHYREGFRFGVLMGLDIAGYNDEKDA